MGKLTSWLLKQETSVKIVPVLDGILLLFSKILYIAFYLSFRISLRLVLGKNKRDKLFANKRFEFRQGLFDKVPPIFFLAKLYFNIIRFFRLHETFLLKITVPKYDYRVYCPVDKDDLINMTVREDEIIEKFCPKVGDTIVDIGAHFGRYTIIASKRVGMNGKVVSIEADPHNFEILNRNIKLNNLTNVISLNDAVYSREAKIKLYLHNEGEQLVRTICNTIMSDRAQSKENFVEVKANTLDYLLQSNGIKQEEVNWIKIDVEGAEYEVLKGAKDILSKSKDISLLIEIHNLSGGTNLYKPIIEYLNLYHFKIDFEKIHVGGERHIIARKKQNNKNIPLLDI
jgi:FkbM family methyltransferase